MKSVERLTTLLPFQMSHTRPKTVAYRCGPQGLDRLITESPCVTDDHRASRYPTAGSVARQSWLSHRQPTSAKVKTRTSTNSIRGNTKKCFFWYWSCVYESLVSRTLPVPLVVVPGVPDTQFSWCWWLHRWSCGTLCSGSWLLHHSVWRTLRCWSWWLQSWAFCTLCSRSFWLLGYVLVRVIEWTRLNYFQVSIKNHSFIFGVVVICYCNCDERESGEGKRKVICSFLMMILLLFYYSRIKKGEIQGNVEMSVGNFSFVYYESIKWKLKDRTYIWVSVRWKTKN
jgi:hypothetical protein